MRPQPIVLAGGAGLRLGEIIALTWRDIDWSSGVLHIRKAAYNHYGGGPVGVGPPKTRGSRRTLPLSSVALGATPVADASDRRALDYHERNGLIGGRVFG